MMARKFGFQLLTGALNVLFYGVAFVGICYICMHGYQFVYNVFSNPVNNASAQTLHTVTVEEGESALEVMKQLEDKGVIADYRVALARLYLSRYEGQLQTGSYYVTAAMPLDEILSVLAEPAQDDAEETTQSP
jgi:cell division protein YceG involved in septum cleavage